MSKILKRKLSNLVSLNIDKYVRRAEGKVEENVKIKLTLPFLELLGFDVQKDMDFEHHVRNKRADIALLFEGSPKLIVETKDLDEDLDHHVDKALDYAFKKGVDWVILTSGIEIRLYKSFITGVPPIDRKIFLTKLEELPQTFSSLEARISKENLKTAARITKDAEEVRESVTANILIKDLAECKQRLFLDLSDQFRIRYKDDRKFKEMIDAWADRVNMSLDDPKLIDKLCTEGAYTLINRLLFLRICEDRRHVKAKFNKDSLKEWRGMVEKPSRMLGLAFVEIKEKFEGLYRAPLFDDIRYEDVKWDEQTINFVLDTLGEHDFGQINKDILGRAYEQHIAKKERKELGQFYTPDFVIDYILDRMDVAPDKKILDPACGSGGFLMKAYDRLKEMYLKEGWAEENIHGEILDKDLYGIDINPFATQLTVMNLFLKNLDHPTSHVNIAEGDSLERLENSFDFDYFDKESPLNKVTTSNKRFSHGMVLKQMPFDIVVGNPPYISFGVRGSRDLAKRRRGLVNTLREKYPNSAEYKISIYAVFMQRGIELLKPGGKLGFVVPDSFLLGRYFSKLRRYILNNCAIEEIVLFLKDFWKYGIVGRPVIIVLRKETDERRRKSNTLTAKLYSSSVDINQDKFKSHSYPQAYFEKTIYNRFRLFFDKASKSFVTKIEKGGVPLGGEEGIVTIRVGVRSKTGQKQIVSESKRGKNWQRGLISGGQIQRYSLEYEGHFLNIDPELLWAGGWDPKIVSSKKLLLRKTGDSLIATYDDKGYYHLDNLHSVVLTNMDFNLKYVLAILNSKLMNHYYHLISLELGRTLAQTDIETIEQLPIRKAAKTEQRTIARLVDKMLLLNEQLQKAKTGKQTEDLKKEIGVIDEKIEKKVRKIYGFE
jgi:adenine-specific DNA-methyltransferase